MAADQVLDLLVRWEECVERGEKITPEDLCADCPELLPDERTSIAVLMQPGTGTNDHGSQRKGQFRATVGDSTSADKLRQSLGEGGVGAVWIAEQFEPVRRQVALKFVKAGMDSRAVLSRFN